MRLFARLLILIEAFVCFGPLLLLLGLGALVAPFWVISLTLDLRDGTEPVPPWDFLYPLLLVLFGALGTLALVCVLFEVISGILWFSARLRMALVAPGILAVLMFNWPWIPTLLAGEMTVDAISPLLMYFVLPVGCSIHLLWLSSRKSLATKHAPTS
jgi:hypothetical protein